MMRAGEGDIDPLIEARTRDFLDHSSTSVDAELGHARTWIENAPAFRQSGQWQVETVAGAIGALSNAWGRLVLWSRSNGCYPGLRDELDGIMDELVVLRERLARAMPTEQEISRLQRLLERMDVIHQTVRQQEGLSPR